MTILALEFSSARRSVALARQGKVLTEAFEQTEGRGTGAFGLIEQVLAAGGSARADVDVLVVGLGPGSYTGIRAALAVAQGWQLARGTPTLGISSVAALAAQAQAAQCFGAVSLVVDAQRGEFYVSDWEISDCRRSESAPLKIVPRREIEARRAAGRMCLGPEMSRVLFPAAAALAALADGRSDFMPAEKLEPIYLRPGGFIKAPVPRLVG